jgi:hypothetical protein
MSLVGNAHGWFVPYGSVPRCAGVVRGLSSGICTLSGVCGSYLITVMPMPVHVMPVPVGWAVFWCGHVRSSFLMLLSW